MTLLAIILQWVLQIFLWMLVGRFILDLLMSFNRGFRPRGLVLVLAEITMTVTDPPLKFVRRFVPNLRLGAVQLDLSFGIVWFLVLLLMRLVPVLFLG